MKRWDKLYDPIMVVAHFLNPQFIEDDLPKDGMNHISNFIMKYYPNDSKKIWSQLLHYKQHNSLFDNPLAWATIDETDLITWWKGNFSLVAPELTNLAIRILSIPTSSAASERNWSAFSYIHDKKRNRLTSDMVFKLVFIYFNYKLQNPKNQDKSKDNVSESVNDDESDDNNEEEEESDDVSEESENDDNYAYTSELETSD